MLHQSRLLLRKTYMRYAELPPTTNLLLHLRPTQAEHVLSSS
ncbi:hypothetical protein PVAG01_04892 [Phlyctema vagabunda]|uniref:Uncharacterized protein n=1 Tax=Phlyctema vagabunda TaxID=108571 RepID=A0ABR4PIM2_9HELO